MKPMTDFLMKQYKIDGKWEIEQWAKDDKEKNYIGVVKVKWTEKNKRLVIARWQFTSETARTL